MCYPKFSVILNIPSSQVPLDSLPLPSSVPHLDVLQLGDEQILANFLLSDSDLSKSMQRSLSPSYFQQFDLGAELWTPETKVC